MQVDEILFSIGRYRARRLWPMDLPLIRTFNQQCSDFFMLQNGTPPNEVEAEEVFNEVPPGRRVEDKLPTGFLIRTVPRLSNQIRMVDRTDAGGSHLKKCRIGKANSCRI